ncbi:MAG TPA: histidine kinase dimerization/phospho-acceptor domain-containing protein [Polyangiaceae bacterium]|nr:histidine kinase dimerization/phospho-acceptor domain-containing protein [Polyangiaceae bacterium]
MKQEFPSASSARKKEESSPEIRVVGNDVARLIAHDLKTPLAAIAINLDFALSELHSDAPSVLRDALTDCRDANARAARTVTDMADAVRLAAGECATTVTEVDAAQIIVDVIDVTRREAQARGLTVRSQAATRIVRANGDLLRRALERTLERSFRDARPASTIEVSLRTRSIAVRVDAVASTDSSARGLAVYFVSAAMRAQGGGFWTEVDADGLLTYRLSFPR